MITAGGGGGNGLDALRSRAMCSLRTVVAQAALMGNIYGHAGRPVILVPVSLQTPLFLIEGSALNRAGTRQSTCPLEIRLGR